MKPVYFVITTLLCLLLFISHGNSQADGDDANKLDKSVKTEDGDGTGQNPVTPTIASPLANNNETSGSRLNGLADPGTMKRMLYVLLAFTSMVIVFFAFKTIRQRTRRKTKKYGVLATPASDVELTPLDQEDDDEDMTVFDANSK